MKGLLTLLSLAALAGCSTQELDGGTLAAPARVSVRNAAEGYVIVDWEPVAGAHEYRVHLDDGRVGSFGSPPGLVSGFDDGIEVSLHMTAVTGGLESPPSPTVYAAPRYVPILAAEPDQLIPEPSDVGARHGTALAAGDVNCDLRDDLVIGAPDNGSGIGDAKIHLGRGLAVSALSDRTVSGSGDSGGEFASSVAVGRVTPGQCADVLVGGPRVQNDTGEAYLYDGDSTTPINQIYTDVGNNQDEQFGDRVAMLGDVNGDSIGDFVVTDRLDSQDNVAFYAGAQYPSSIPFDYLDLQGGSPDANVPFPIADLSGDGRGEVFMGSPGQDFGGTNLNDHGTARIYSWATGQFVNVWQSDGAGGEGDQFGFSVATLDVENDELEDLVVGAPGTANDRGALQLFARSDTGLAETPALTVAGAASDGEFAYALATAGDMDGDGRDDLFVASPGNGGIGRVHLFIGGTASLNETWSAAGDEPGSRFGHAIASGDFNGDGIRDLAVGAPNRSSGLGANAGEVSIFLAHIGLGPLADAGEALQGAAGESLTPQGAWIVDRAQRRKYACTWDAGDLTAPVTIEPCTAETVGNYHHVWTSAGRYELRLRVVREDDGIFGEAAVTVTIE